jgi:hypothetical protein
MLNNQKILLKFFFVSFYCLFLFHLKEEGYYNNFIFKWLKSDFIYKFPGIIFINENFTINNHDSKKAI